MIPEHLLIESVLNSNLEFPINPPLIADTNNQLYLKIIAIINQGGYCVCGNELTDGELHHALISKKDIMGRDQNLIHDSRNVLVLHHDCHVYATRRRCLEFLHKIFGDDVLIWYESIEIERRIL